MDIPVLPCLVTCYSATTYLLPQHTAAVWILVVAICHGLLLAPAARTAGAAGRLVTIIGTRGMVYDHITFAGVIMGAALVLGPPKNMVWLGDFGVKT